MERKRKSFGMTLLNSDCSVTSFFPEDRPDIIKKLSETTYNHVNYDNLDWFEFDCVSILQNGDDIVGFSSVWHRPEYYKKGEVRILNRYWENNELRRIGRELARSHIISIVKDQLRFAKELGYTSAFISREKNPRMLREFINKVAIATDTIWNIHDERVSVCDGHGCLQYKGYTEL